MRKLLADTGGGLQEGVVGATASALDFKVTQRGAGANMSVDVAIGFAWNQIDTGTNNGFAHISNDAIANVGPFTASSGTNPRIDQVILRYNDTSIPTGSGNTPTLEILTGTATGAASLDTRAGAAALPSDCQRIADVLIPTSSTSVVTANIRDRRPMARGQYNLIVRTQNAAAGSNYTTTATSAALMDSTNLQPRIECTAVPLTVRFRGVDQITGVPGILSYQLWVDGAKATSTRTAPHRIEASASSPNAVDTEWSTTPAAGSHLIGLAWSVNAGTGLVSANATDVLTFEVIEMVRQNTSNT
jgi:hypothetical protein